MAKIVLTQDQHSTLNSLADMARHKRQIAKEAHRKRKEGKEGWDRWYVTVRKEAEEASDTHRKAYRKLGIPSKQAEYQRECVSKGLCRECGQVAESGTYCQECRLRARSRSKERAKK